MLIGKYDLEIFAPLCETGAERFAAIARLNIDISEALPLLNAALSVAVYHRRRSEVNSWKIV
jgi:hypothetical protein